MWQLLKTEAFIQLRFLLHSFHLKIYNPSQVKNSHIFIFKKLSDFCSSQFSMVLATYFLLPEASLGKCGMGRLSLGVITQNVLVIWNVLYV